jgi:Reverse transcriptase (RNA-dependent DNA polymerase)
VLREAYATVLKLFNYLYPIFMANNYHPKCFKEATEIILKKPQSVKSSYKNYTLPKAYKIISLLNCLIKVMKKIIARRLAVITKFKTLLYKYQIGGRRQKSAINAVIVLIQKVQANWRTRKRDFITSVLALDIKNAYLTIRTAPFAKICIRIKLLTELIK